MKQSRLASFLESCGNTLSGFLLGIICQMIFLPLLGVTINHTQNLIFAGIMTVVSICRSFCWRRLMEALHVRRPLSPFMQAVIAERYRQIEQEGWSAEHDDKSHKPGDLALAGAAYAERAHAHFDWGVGLKITPPGSWPWSSQWWKPTEFRRDLVKGAALILAEGERFDRTKTRRAS